MQSDPHCERAAPNPYPGLAAYTERWAGVFFGRNREVFELLNRVRDARSVTGRFIPVIGPSGSGKSSLVLAGLVSALHDRSDFRVLPAFSPGIDAVGELGAVLGTELSAPARTALAAARAGEAAPRLDDVLAALARVRAGTRRLLIIVDQLEEAVTQCIEEDRHAFLALMEALLEHEPRLRVVATVRSETIGVFQQGPGRDLFHDPLMVNVMGPHEIRLVVQEPARLTHTTFDDGLAEEIIRDAGGGDALPLLSYLLSDLYRTATGDRHISWREYESSGGVSGAITRRADAAVRELGPGALEHCLNTLLRFVTLSSGGATRQHVAASTLDEQQREVVRAFVDARLLISDCMTSGEHGAVYDIAHEALLRQWQPLREHIALHEESLRRLTELAPMARAWLRSGRQPDYLITGGRLRDALAWVRDGWAVPVEVRDFLEESQRNQAGEMDRRANRAAREALASLNTAPETAFGLALAAYTELAPTHLAGYALEVVLAAGLIRVIPHPSGVLSVAAAADGRLATACGDETVQIWTSSGALLHTLRGHDDGAIAVAFGPDGDLATLAGATMRIWDAKGKLAHTCTTKTWGSTFSFTADGALIVGATDGSVCLMDPQLRLLNTLRSQGSAVHALASSVDGRIAGGFSDGTVLIWDARGRPERELSDHTDCVFALAFGPDGTLAVGARDATITLWDAAGHRIGRRTGHHDAVKTLAFSPCGHLASGASDGAVRVWAPDGRLAHVLTEHREPVNALAFSPAGLLVVVSADTTVRIWDLQGRLVSTVVDIEDAQTLGFAPNTR